MDSTESKHLLDILAKNPGVVHGMNFVYRMNPLVQDMKNKVAQSHIGQPRLIHGSYLQDWLLYDTDYNWRVEPEIGGTSRCIADIGSHWMDCVQTVTGSKISEVCADLVIVHPIRKKPSGQENNYGANGEYIGLDVKAMITQPDQVSYRHLENSLKMAKMLEKKAENFDYGFQRECMQKRDYEALEMYVMELLLKG